MGSRSLRSWRAVPLALALIASATSVRAQEASGTVTLHSECPELPWANREWIHLLRIELLEAPSDEATSRIDLTLGVNGCTRDATSAELTLRSKAHDPRVRVVGLTGIDESGRARVLALAAAELVRSTRRKVTSATSPDPLSTAGKTEPASPTPTPAGAGAGALEPGLPPIAPEPRWPWSVYLAGEARSFLEGATLLFGPRIGASIPVYRWVALELDAGASFGNARDPIGEVVTRVGFIGAGIVGQLRSGSIHFSLGPRLEAGLARSSGTSDSTTVSAFATTSPLVLATLSAAAHVRIYREIEGRVGLTGGTSVYGLRGSADGRIVSVLAGPMVGLHLGIAWPHQ